MVWKLVATALVSAILIAYLKNAKSDLVAVATVAAGVVLLVLSLSAVKDVVSSLNSLAFLSNIDSTMLVIVIKITGIAYLIEFASTTIEEFGSKSIADKVAFGGKIMILALAMPVIKSLVSLIGAVASGGAA